jgi:signal transduction histidine kinase/DNA-binding response OmpR family regulator
MSLQGFDQFKQGGVLLKARGEDYFEPFVLSGEFSNDFVQSLQRLSIDDNLCGQAQTQLLGNQIIFGNCLRDSGSVTKTEFGMLHGHCLIPVMSGGVHSGVLFLNTNWDFTFTESRLTMLTQIGEMMALALLQEQARLALEESRDAAVQAALTKSEFLANMSHEIRTPMNGVLGMLDLLKDTILSREQSELLDTAANSAEALLDIINDILDFSKLEAGKIEVEKIEFDLPVVVEEVCTLMANRAHAKGLELNCFVPANLPRRWNGDPTRIRQVLTNLIGNAVKFTEKGEVSIKIIEKPFAEHHSEIRVEIQDTGIGIAPEIQARLFQPFSQADSSTARRYGGTGLGLSISRDLVRLMDGIIGVDSEQGNGSRFWFALPLQPAESSIKANVVDLTGQRALIVDDNATNRIILEHYLTHWGLSVFQVDNAVSALEELNAGILRNEPYTLLLSDLHMPDMDGYDLIRAVNKNPALLSLSKMILTSGSSCNESERAALGISHCLLKPVRQTHLFDAIVNSLQSASRQEPNNENSKCPAADFSGKRVLVAEDNKVNQKVILGLLAKFNLQADMVENGQEVLDQLFLRPYDLVLMDCQMPIMDGYETVRYIRARELSLDNATRMPIIALTAHAAVGEREKCLAAGMDDHLSKPISRKQLEARLRQWFGLSMEHRTMTEESGKQTSEKALLWDEPQALKRLEGDQELLADIIELFLEESPTQVSALNEACQKADILALAETAHKIKGMAGHFCADVIVSLAAELENKARTNKLGDFNRMAEELIRVTKELTENLSLRRGKVYE